MPQTTTPPDLDALKGHLQKEYEANFKSIQIAPPALQAELAQQFKTIVALAPKTADTPVPVVIIVEAEEAFGTRILPGSYGLEKGALILSTALKEKYGPDGETKIMAHEFGHFLLFHHPELRALAPSNMAIDHFDFMKKNYPEVSRENLSGRSYIDELHADNLALRMTCDPDGLLKALELSKKDNDKKLTGSVQKLYEEKNTDAWKNLPESAKQAALEQAKHFLEVQQTQTHPPFSERIELIKKAPGCPVR